jgi:hypothetical protein
VDCSLLREPAVPLTPHVRRFFLCTSSLSCVAQYPLRPSYRMLDLPDAVKIKPQVRARDPRAHRPARPSARPPTHLPIRMAGLQSCTPPPPFPRPLPSAAPPAATRALPPTQATPPPPRAFHHHRLRPPPLVTPASRMAS